MLTQKERERFYSKKFKSNNVHCNECQILLSFPPYVDIKNTVYNPFAPNSVQIDHIYPKSKSGCKKNWNLQLLCRKCNQSKSKKTKTSKFVYYLKFCFCNLIKNIND
jgi:5-methylcytosine-specific restriction endonuclease McrA